MMNKRTVILAICLMAFIVPTSKAMSNEQLMNLMNKVNKKEEVLQGRLNEERMKAQLELERIHKVQQEEKRKRQQAILSASTYNQQDVMRGARDLKKIKEIITNSNPPQKVRKLINSTIKYVGKPYVFGADDIRTAGHAYDCSGFTKSIYGKVGYNLPRTARGQIRVVKRIHPSEVKMGDLVFFERTYNVKGASHVGIYLKDGYMVHASSGKGYITVDSLMNNYWIQHFVGFGRLIESEGENYGSK